ncbi:MAG: hypothetical protein Q4G40_10560 [Brachybacterium sp.]|nr:hypothetical protein [Brachybacterium sp.]
MSILANAVLRAVPGAFILNSGIGKIGMPADAAKGLQEMAAQGVPAVGDMTPEQFGKFLTYGEIAVGAALLTPLVPTRVAGAALGALSAGFIASYFSIPSMTKEDGVRPSDDGTALAKDTWLGAIAVALMLGGAGRK